MINLVKNKNKLEKIETTRKHNIQKCINWCDKYKLPYNKFADKINIFLPISAHDREFAKTEISSGVVENDENDENGSNECNSEDSSVYISNNNIDDGEVFDNNIINKDLLHEIEYGVE